MGPLGGNCGGCLEGLKYQITGRQPRREDIDLAALGFLDEPNCEKEFDEGGGDGAALTFGSCSMQGWRLRNEDAQCCKMDIGGDPACSLFAVFDGHGGPEVAKFCAQNLPAKLQERIGSSQGCHAEALRDSFLAMDTAILAEWPKSLSKQLPLEGEGSTDVIRPATQLDADPYARGGPGCAALACVIQGGRIHLANVGDCRAVLSRGGKAVNLTVDHTPELETERIRIFQAGGYLEDGRVNGCLNLSRCIGDFHFKQNRELPPEAQVISPEADIYSLDIQPEDEFIMLGCDGVWERFSAQQVVDFVRERLHARQLLSPHSEEIGGQRLAAVAGDLLDRLLARNIYTSDGLGLDNMTCLIIDLSRAQARGFLLSLYEKVVGG